MKNSHARDKLLSLLSSEQMFRTINVNLVHTEEYVPSQLERASIQECVYICIHSSLDKFLHTA